MDQYPLLVSVVISTRNHAGRLARTLGGLSRLSIPEGVSLEVVVVDNGSTDQTAAVLQDWAGKLPLRSLLVPEPGLSRAKNAGVEAARGTLLLCTDDDVDVPPHWLAAYVEAFRTHGDRHFYGGPVVPDYEGPKPDPALRRYTPASIRGLDWGPVARPLRDGEYFIGPNWACPAERFRAVGGYDTRVGYNSKGGPSRGGEETDLMKRLAAAGVSGWYVPDASVAHWVPAANTRPEHLYLRYESVATERAWQRPEVIPGPRIRGVPVRLPLQLARAMIRHALSLIGMGDRLHTYGDLRWRIGLLRGYLLPPRSSRPDKSSP